MSSRHILRLSKLTNNSNNLTLGSPDENEDSNDDETSIIDIQPVLTKSKSYFNNYSDSDDESSKSSNSNIDDTHSNEEEKSALSIEEEININILPSQKLQNKSKGNQSEKLNTSITIDSSKGSNKVNSNKNNKKNKSNQKDIIKSSKELTNDNDLLDTILQEHQEQLLSNNDMKPSVHDRLMLRLKYNELLFKNDDIKNLDIDNTLRKRFGPQNPMDDRNHNNANHQRGVSKSNILATHRKYIFSNNPKDSWKKAPSYITGGIGMNKYYPYNNNKSNNSSNSSNNTNSSSFEYYSFEWSDEYTFLNNQFTFIENSGDINLLVMFLIHFPYHPNGFYQLAMIYTKLGLIDRAFDLIRRGLYVLECASLSSFKPTNLQCRMDPTFCSCNKEYFDLLYRYMQLCSMQGCNSVAADVCRYILSLHPVDDQYYLLLTLDFYLVSASKYETILTYCNLSEADLNALNTRTTNYQSFTFNSIYIFDLFDDYDRNSSNIDDMVDSKSGRSLQHLPNWWFSLAISRWQYENTNHNKKQYSSSSTSTTATATLEQGSSMNNNNNGGEVSRYLLKAALYHWPFMVELLLLKAGIDAKTLAASVMKPWIEALSHPFFHNAIHRVPQDSYLYRISEIYSIRNAVLWNREEVHKWVLQCMNEIIIDLNKENSLENRCKRITNDIDIYDIIINKQIKEYSELLMDSANNNIINSDNINNYIHNKYIIQYKNAKIEEFTGKYIRFPNDLNPIDPQFNDPNIFDGGIRFNNFMDNQGRFLFPIENRFLLNRNNHQHNLDQNQHPRNPAILAPGVLNPIFHDEQVLLQAQADEVEEEECNIDLNLPLMQLFIATLFPWIYVNRRRPR